MNNILKITDNYSVDESIINKQTYGFNVITGSQLNNPGSITISIQNTDNFYYPAESWLQFEGVVEKSGAAGAFADTDQIAIANNGILFLFDNIKYLLASSEIESIFNPGTTSNIIGLAKYPDGFEKGLMQCWSRDSSDIAEDDKNSGFEMRRSLILGSKPTPLGSFRFAIPLKHIFGFCQDYEKIIYGFTHTLVLTRSSSDKNALFRKNGVADGKITLKNIKWMIPRITPNEQAKYELHNQIKTGAILNVGFRMTQCISTTIPETTEFTYRLGVRSAPEQPRYIFVAFQTARAEDQEKNYATYDHCNVQSAHILLNNDRYPLNDFETDFTKNHFDNQYHEFASFIRKFYKIDDSVVSTAVGPIAYKALFPILFFDVSHQSERLKTGVTDITLHCRFKSNVPAATVAHIVIISDRKIRFKSDGAQMSVLY